MSTVANPTYRQRVGYQAGLLGGFALVAAALLVMGDIATHEAIAEREAEDLLASLAEVIPPALHDNDLLANTLTLTIDGADGAVEDLTVYRALQGLDVSAVAYEVTGQGYAGAIQVLLGIGADGRVLGARVLSHAETPGLGDKIEKDSAFVGEFRGALAPLVGVKPGKATGAGGEIDMITGATISSQAIVDIINARLAEVGDPLGRYWGESIPSEGR